MSFDKIFATAVERELEITVKSYGHDGMFMVQCGPEEEADLTLDEAKVWLDEHINQ